MVYRSPYPSNIKPTTAHLDDALKDFIVQALDTLQQRGITDILGGTEVELRKINKNPLQDKFTRLGRQLRNHWAQEPDKIQHMNKTFHGMDTLMALLHEKGTIKDLL